MTTNTRQPRSNYTQWPKTARLRQTCFLTLLIIPAILAAFLMAQTLPGRGGNPLEAAIIIVFATLFGGIALGFWLSFFGLLTLARQKADPWAITKYLKNSQGELANLPLNGHRTAVLMPICQEDIVRVMAGVSAIYESLARTGQLEHYEFFILSDSRSPDLWVNEETTWAAFTKKLGAEGRMHYRRRRVNLKRKSGNIADFCRRWGGDFEFMIVLDADSVMSGETLVTLTKLMIKRPEVGLIQTVPTPAMKMSPLARLQQFCAQAYGPIFAAGLHWILLGGALFWGHNAIIRIKPFMEHCGLPRLSGLGPLGGDIMSHDFVESALLKRAGWDVWLAYDLAGSYEEVPTTLLDELKRDQRWCQGNLQHLKILWAKGLSFTQRLMFLNGAFSYLSAFFWFVALILSSIEAALIGLTSHNYFPQMSLFPEWPTWSGHWTIILLVATAILLFAPKGMALLLIVFQGRAQTFGGIIRLFLSAFAETLFSTLTAPVRMLFHSKVVVLTFMGTSAGWKSQNRDDRAVPFSEALKFHLGGMVLAIIWAVLIRKSNPSFFWWLSPIWISLLIAPLSTVISSSPKLGQKLYRWGLWRTPCESSPPEELLKVEKLDKNRELPVSAFDHLKGFEKAVLDPKANSIHLSLLGSNRKLENAIRLRRQMLVARLFDHGPDSLNDKEKIEILSDQVLLGDLHRQLWVTTDNKFSKWMHFKKNNLKTK